MSRLPSLAHLHHQGLAASGVPIALLCFPSCFDSTRAMAISAAMTITEDVSQ